MVDFSDFGAVKRELKKLGNAERAKVTVWYAPGAKNVYGATMPNLRKLNRELIKFCKENPEKGKKIILKLWKSGVFECMWIGEDAVRGLNTKDTVEIIEKIKGGINNWMHSDTLLIAIGKHCKREPEVFMKLAERYSKDKHPWIRRLGIIFPIKVFVYYPKYLERALKILGRNMKDDHVYIRKGVSWACANCYMVDKAKTQKWLKKWEGNEKAEKSLKACYSRIKAYEKRRKK
jgi:3-methyladenine DNA glycosylase AlkD